MKWLLATVFVVVLAALLSGSARADNLYAGNPADPELLEVTFTNPALNAFIRDRVNLAMTSHQTGVAGRLFSLNSGAFGYHLPWKMRGAAVGLQYLQAGLYSEKNIRFSYGRRIFGDFAVGVNMDFFNHAFDQGDFYKVDAGDPVLSGGTSKWGVSFGAGLAYRPHPAFMVGISFEHLNRPDQAFGSDPILQPVVVNTGMKIRVRGVNFFSSFSGLRMDDLTSEGPGSPKAVMADRTQVGVEIPAEGFGAIRLSSGSRAVYAEFEAHLYSYWFLNYRYEYPLTDIRIASSGTHRFGFVYDIHRQPPIPRAGSFPMLPSHAAEKRKRPLPKPDGRFFVYPDRDEVVFTRRTLTRSVEDEVDPGSLVHLFPEDLGDISGITGKTSTENLEQLDVRDPTVLPQNLYSPPYWGSLEGIGFMLKNRKVKTGMIAFSGAERRANELLNVITGEGYMVPRTIPVYLPEKSPMTSLTVRQLLNRTRDVQELVLPDTVTFTIVPVFLENGVKKWSFEIRNWRNELLWSTGGFGPCPDKLKWDWRSAGGGELPTGIYTYSLSCETSEGREKRSAFGQFSVIHKRRSYSFDISGQVRLRDMNADQLILILGGASGGGQAKMGSADGDGALRQGGNEAEDGDGAGIDAQSAEKNKVEDVFGK